MLKRVLALVVMLMCAGSCTGVVSSQVKVSAEEAREADSEHTNGHAVCLDPGHQSYEIDMSGEEPNGPGSSVMKAGATSGTQGSFTGIPEYALNLDVSLILRDILEKRGYRVIMTRTDNETAISNRERAVMAGEEGAEIFVRIHANGDSTQQNSGALALCPSSSNPYVASLYEESDKLSSCILGAYCAATGFSNLGVQYSDTMTGINWSTVPVTILEMGFMTNESDDMQMANVEFRQIMAAGIADGIDAYFGIDTSAFEEEAEELLEESAESVRPSKTALSSVKDNEAMKELRSQLPSRLPQGNGQWAVYVGDLSTGASCVIESGSDQTAGSAQEDSGSAAAATESKTGRMQAASLIKLYIMGAVCEKYEELAEICGAEQLDSLLYSMIVVSDNDAANTLTSYLGDGDPDAGMQAVTAYCEAHDYKDSHMGRLLLHSNEFDDNYTSVQDCGLFLTRIYNGRRSKKPEMAEKMFDLLSQQTRTHKIPSRLPEGVHVANKTGELADVESDAGIIYDTAKGNDLVLCVMSEKVSSPGNAQTFIGELAQFVYAYYNE